MSYRNILNILTAALLAGATLACTDTTPRAHPVSGTAESPTNRQIYQVKGTVREVTTAEKRVKIAHEKIPNYMEAMTMNFDVKDAQELANLEPGDLVSFRMIVTADDGWIDQIQKIGRSTEVVANAPDSFRRVREVEPLKVGDVVPDYPFTNELGKAVSLKDFRGEAVAMTFIFTRCPFPTFCPRMSSHFDEAFKKLQAQPDAPKNWRLLTITFDPQFDTPAVLKQYAQRYAYDPKHVSYLTGELIEITALTEQVGLLFWRPDPNEVTGISHNLRTVVLDTQGRVQKIFTENQWTPEDLANELVKAAQVKPQADAK